MSSDEEYNVAARYRTVRKRLDSLGYQQALPLDALPLIEQVLADLIQTTESLKHFKSVAQENVEAYNQLQLIIDPYKCDNARLVQECNQLHSDLIEIEEAYQKQIKDLKKQVYKLECECNDLQLASSRNLQKIKDLEIESAKKSKKILELQGKCLKPIISNVGIASKKRPCYPPRRPVIEAEPLPKTGSSSLPSIHAVEPKILDLLSMADHKMSCLTHEVTKLKGELSLQTDNVYALQDQLTMKEKEIMRLKRMLEGGRPYSAVVKDCLCKNVDKINVMPTITSEDNDLKILLKNRQELEQQLKEAISKQHEAMSQAMKLAERNEELEKELKDIDHIALAVEADCNSAVKENNKRVCELQEKLEDMMEQFHALENELAAKRREVQELTADLEACKLEKRNIQRTLESTLEEKKRVTNKINQLTIIEKSLNDEIERLSKENECQKQDIIQLQYTNKVLKEQLNMAKTVDTRGDDEKQLKEKREKNDQNRGRRITGDRTDVDSTERSSPVQETSSSREEQKSGNNGISDNMQKLIIEKNRQIDNLQQTIKQLEKERDYYKNECNDMEYKKSESSNKDNVELWTRSYELRCQLNEKEKTIFELQKEKNDLCREKMELEARLEACKNQQKRSCISCRSCKICKTAGSYAYQPTTSFDVDTNATKIALDSLEHERDLARADVQRLTEERNVLYEQLRTSRGASVSGLEDQLEDTKEELRKTKQELMVQRTQCFQLRALQDQTEQALGDVQGQLSQSETELNEAIDRNRNMEQQQLQLDNQVKELKQEINTLHANMAHLDREKDQLLMMLDEKTEKIVALERELVHKEQQAMGMEQQMRDLRHKNEICIDQSVERERQLRSLQLEMEDLQRQLETANGDRENAIQENRRLQDDLAAVMYELRNLQRELDSSRVESYDLKKQLQTYVSEVRRAEEMLNRKENERSEMLNHFRSLSLEATVLENNNHSLESEAAEARGALQSATDRLLDLERQLADKDSLIREYEAQISELTQTVASMETQLRQQTEQRLTTEADLNAVRDLCIKLDQQKDALVQQLEEKDMMKAQYETQLAGLRAEQDVIQDQMDRDRATVERLEALLDQARQESINVQTTNQELQNEMCRLRQKISELQTKLSSESMELKQYQNQAAEYSKQISELRRQVTNERFDRARKEEESRRFLSQEKYKDHCVVTCKSCATEAVPLGISNKEYIKSDRGNESTTNNNIQVDLSERTRTDVMEPVATSTPKRFPYKNNCISCCTNTELPNREKISLQLSDHYIIEPYRNNHDCYITSYRRAGTQAKKINNQYSIVSDSSECQFCNELKMSGKILPCCAIPKDQSENTTVNISDRETNKTGINDTIEDLYIRNVTKRLNSDHTSDNISHHFTEETYSDLKSVINYEDLPSDFATINESELTSTKNVVLKDKTDEIPLVKTEYENINGNNTESLVSDKKMPNFYEKNLSDFTDKRQSVDKEATNDIKDSTISNQCKTIVIIVPRPKFKKILSGIKENTKSLEEQIGSLNNILKNILILSDQQSSSVLEVENRQNSDEHQTEKSVDTNNNDTKPVMDKYIKKRTYSVSSLTEKSTIIPTEKKPVENDKHWSSYVEKKEEVPTAKSDVKSTPYKHTNIEVISCSDKDCEFSTKTHEIEPTSTKDICDRMSYITDTAYSYHSTVETRDSIYNLYLQTTSKQSSNCPTIAAGTSVSSSNNKFNSNSKSTNLKTTRNVYKKSSNAPAMLNAFTTVDDLRPSISIQCITISKTSFQLKNLPPSDSRDKLTKVKRSNKRPTLRN